MGIEVMSTVEAERQRASHRGRNVEDSIPECVLKILYRICIHDARDAAELPPGYKSRDLALRHSFMDISPHDQSQYLLGREDFDEEAAAILGLMQLAYAVLIHQVEDMAEQHPALNPSKLPAIRKTRFSVDAQNGLLAAVTLGTTLLPDRYAQRPDARDTVTIVLEDGTGNQPAVAALSGQGIASGPSQSQEQEQLDWRFSTALLGDSCPPGDWYNTAEEAVLVFAQGAQSGQRRNQRPDHGHTGDQRREEAHQANDEEERTDVITTAADFWDGFSSDEGEREGAGESSRHGAPGRKDGSVVPESEAEDNDDDAYWAGYDQVETVVGEVNAIPTEAGEEPSRNGPKPRLEAKEATRSEALQGIDESLLMTLRGAWSLYRTHRVHLSGSARSAQGDKEELRRRFLDLARRAAM